MTLLIVSSIVSGIEVVFPITSIKTLAEKLKHEVEVSFNRFFFLPRTCYKRHRYANAFGILPNKSAVN